MTTLPEEAGTLWAVNIHGPDDLIAAPDYLSAVRMANAFNAWWLNLKTKQPHNDAIDALVWAIPTDWPGNDAQGHAVELSKPHPEYQWLREALSALEPSAGRAAVLEEGYRQGIEAAAKLIECGCKDLLHGKGECQFPGNCSLEDAAAIRSLSSPDHADAGKVEGDGCKRCGGKGEIVVGKGRHGDTIIEDCPSCSTPQDVINLVIAAREACDTWLLPECEFKRLDKALDAFSERVPFENEPDTLPSAPASEGAE